MRGGVLIAFMDSLSARSALTHFLHDGDNVVFGACQGHCCGLIHAFQLGGSENIGADAYS